MFILAGICSIRQHIQKICSQPEDYQPERCPHCNCARLWRHGVYLRKSDRERKGLGLVPVLRFFCALCQRTCSTLPECLPPRRWFSWRLQQAILHLLLQGHSLHAASRLFPPARSTLRRWWHHLQRHFLLHRDALLTHYPQLGLWSQFKPFWLAYLSRFSLSEAMLTLNRQGISVP